MTTTTKAASTKSTATKSASSASTAKKPASGAAAKKTTAAKKPAASTAKKPSTAAQHKADVKKADEKKNAPSDNTELKQKPDVNIVDTQEPETDKKVQDTVTDQDSENNADNSEQSEQSENMGGSSVLKAAGELLDAAGDLEAAGENVDIKSGVDLDQYISVLEEDGEKKLQVNYPAPDFSEVQFPTVESITEKVLQVALSEESGNDTPITAMRNGNVSRLVNYLKRNVTDAECTVMIDTLMQALVILPNAKLRDDIDRRAQGVVNELRAERERTQQEAEENAAREAMIEMQDQLIQSFIDKGMSPEAAKQHVQSVIDSTRKATARRATGTGQTFSYDRVLIRHNDKEFEMGVRGFHSPAIQKLWESENMTKDEFIKKYTVKVVRKGTV